MARQETLQAFLALIGAAIVREREVAEKSQEDLAYEAGMSVRHLRELERGRANPTISTLWRVAENLGVDVRSLLVKPRRR